MGGQEDVGKNNAMIKQHYNTKQNEEKKGERESKGKMEVNEKQKRVIHIECIWSFTISFTFNNNYNNNIYIAMYQKIIFEILIIIK